ncbi:MAG: holo-ACP synthase [Gammaproteobacteria bacterium]
MIYGVGVDIAEIARFAAAHERFGVRFAERILDHQELRGLADARNPARYLAMRFAAKEATSKALGTGFKQGIAPRQIGVVHAPSGKPGIAVNGNAATMFERLGIVASHVSLSDDGGFAIAFVVLETQPPHT